jgi:hypothetical protein
MSELAYPMTINDLVQSYRELQRIAKERGIEPYAWTVGNGTPCFIYEITGYKYPKPGRQVRRLRVWTMKPK